MAPYNKRMQSDWFYLTYWDFLWAPLSLAGVSIDLPVLTRAANGLDKMAYRSWIVSLGEESFLFQLCYNNTVYWCGKFEHCNAG